MAASPDKMEQILERVRSKVKNYACGLCGQNGWELTAFLQLFISDDPKNASLGGPSLPLCAMTCKSCGNTHLLNLIILGVMMPEAGAKN